MLMPSKEVQARLEKYQTIDGIEAEALKLEWKRERNRHNLATRAIAGVVLMGALIAGYAHDTQENKQKQADASVSVEVVAPALDEANNTNALVFTDGFRSNSGDKLAEYMSKAFQPVLDGQILSVDYNNAPLDSDEIAKQIIATATSENITSMTLVGYSAGGDIAMQVQEKIREDSHITIKAIILISTPNGVKTLRPARQDEIDFVEKIAWIPDVEYSSTVRFLGELASRADRYTTGTPVQMVQNLISSAEEVNEQITSNEFAEGWLMFDQMLTVETTDNETLIANMDKIPTDKTRPVIVYFGTAAPGYDYVVDSKESSEGIGGYADKAHVPFLSYEVPGAIHSRVDLANDQYVEIAAKAKDAILASIAAQEAEASLHRVTSIVPPTTSLK